MAEKIACPLCGEIVAPCDRNGTSRLHTHLYYHLPTVGDTMLRRCWCGVEFWWSQPARIHWQEHGGFVAHYLAYHLGGLE